MCPLHELTSDAKRLLHNKDISLLFIYIDFPVKCVLALGTPTELRRKISFFPLQVNKSQVMSLVFTEKKDRSRGLALSCLLERKEGKCITETESCDSDGREHQNIQTKESQIVEVVV